MKTTDFLFLLLCFTVSFVSCKGQSSDKITLSKIIFHSSRCNGDCPMLDLEIDSSKQIFVSRQYFKHKDEIKTPYSGQFKGTLIEDDYKKLIALLKDCDLETLKFPVSDEMDGVEITIIIYYNEQRKYFKSPEPPSITKGLISFLTVLAENKQLQKTDETRLIEQ